MEVNNKEREEGTIEKERVKVKFEEEEGGMRKKNRRTLWESKISRTQTT